MGRYVIKLPDVGEGVAEAELGEWRVAVGDRVEEDQVLAVVMTDKAAVDVPSPVAGVVEWLGGEAGDAIAVGAVLLRLQVAGDGNDADRDDNDRDDSDRDDSDRDDSDRDDSDRSRDGERGDGSRDNGDERAVRPRDRVPAATTPNSTPTSAATAAAPAASGAAPAASRPPRAAGEKPLASPAVRRRARDAGVDLRAVAGSGPAGRITHDDLEQYFQYGGDGATARGRRPDTRIEEIRIIGLRRKIAERMTHASARIPHITYVDDVDVEALETLRKTLNDDDDAGERPKLTLLPFLIRALVKAIAAQPLLNAHYDDDAGVLRRYGGVHVGVAVQTANGLLVPVLRHAEARDLWDCAAETARLAAAARAGAASRDELSGSTITVSSLGALGGIVSTPIINAPEVAVIGVNKIQTLPVWDAAAGGFAPRRVMNLSSSFDHRIVDGWDAATFIQTVKRLLETPARLFIED